MFRAIEAFRLFDLVYILTSGGPGVTTETLSFHVYKVAFFGFDTGTRVGLRDPHGHRRDRARAVLPALPQQAQGGVMAISIDQAVPGPVTDDAPPARRRRWQGAERDRGRAARGPGRRHALPGAVDARDVASRRTATSTPCPRRSSTSTPRSTTSRTSSSVPTGDARTCPVVPQLGHRRRRVDDARHRARRPGGVGLLALHAEGQEGPAVLHPLDPLHAAGRRRDPDLPDVPRARAHRQQARPDPRLRRVQRAVHDLDDEGLRRRGARGVRGRRDARRLHALRGVLAS